MENSFKKHDRFDYSAIIDRPDFSWPDNKRMAFYIALNLEEFEFGKGEGATLANSNPDPDVLNYAWRDYGNRVGVWRMIDLFNELEIPLTVLPNTALFETAPRLIKAFEERGDEIAAHGVTNSERQGEFDQADEKNLIEITTQSITNNSKNRPKGWLGPWISESMVTPDLLEEAGYEYLMDWAHDEHPIWMKTRKGKILSVPYPQELNDVPQIVGRQHSAEEFCDMIEKAFEVQINETQKRSSVFGIALHPYLMGQPHRFYYLEKTLRKIKDQFDDKIWLTTAGEINDYWRENNF